jgi:hypothetical protein
MRRALSYMALGLGLLLALGLVLAPNPSGSTGPKLTGVALVLLLLLGGYLGLRGRR